MNKAYGAHPVFSAERNQQHTVDPIEQPRRKKMTGEAKQKRPDYTGYHCAEWVSKTIVELHAQKPSSEIPRVASGFGGGIGATREDVCGALTGGIIAIGYLYGRMEPGEDIGTVSELAAEFRNRFIEEFGSTNCRVILESFGGQGNNCKCKRLVVASTRMLSDLLKERGV